jgi:hypothetical protein
VKTIILVLHILSLGIFWKPSLNYLYKYATTPEKIAWYLKYYSPKEDMEIYDHWKSPRQFIRDGGGDCEDYAVIAYELLLRIGYHPKIYILSNPKIKGPNHAICTFELGLFSNQILYNRNGDSIFSFMKANNYTEYEPCDWRQRQSYIRRTYE